MSEKTKHYWTKLPNEEEWAHLYVKDDFRGRQDDAVLEDGDKHGCSNMWWPEGNEPNDDEQDDRYEALVKDHESVEVNMERFCQLVADNIGYNNPYGRDGKKFFALRFEDDEAEFYTQATTEKEAITKFIDHIKDNIGEM